MPERARVVQVTDDDQPICRGCHLVITEQQVSYVHIPAWGFEVGLCPICAEKARGKLRGNA